MSRHAWLAVLTCAVPVALAIPMSSLAMTITFVGPYGAPVAPATEGIFTYSTFSGGLYRDAEGNGDLFNMEGCSACGGGVMSVIRDDRDGGLFTFEGADIAAQLDGFYPITFTGYVGGELVGTDIFITTSGGLYVSVIADVLAGIPIDELHVQLDATLEFATVIDNLVVTPTAVPLPATLGLLASGLFGLAACRRKRDALHIVAASTKG